MVKKKTFQEVKQLFDDRGFILLETEYVNSKYLMEYRCPKHFDAVQKIRFNDLKSGIGCPKCGKESASVKQKLSFDDVKKRI